MGLCQPLLGRPAQWQVQGTGPHPSLGVHLRVAAWAPPTLPPPSWPAGGAGISHREAFENPRRKQNLFEGKLPAEGGRHAPSCWPLGCPGCVGQGLCLVTTGAVTGRGGPTEAPRHVSGRQASQAVRTCSQPCRERASPPESRGEQARWVTPSGDGGAGREEMMSELNRSHGPGPGPA